MSSATVAPAIIDTPGRDTVHCWSSVRSRMLCTQEKKETTMHVRRGEVEEQCLPERSWVEWSWVQGQKCAGLEGQGVCVGPPPRVFFSSDILWSSAVVAEVASRAHGSIRAGHAMPHRHIRVEPKRRSHAHLQGRKEQGRKEREE